MPLLNNSFLLVSATECDQNLRLVSFRFGFGNCLAFESAGDDRIDIRVGVDFARRIFERVVRSTASVLDEEVEPFDEGFDYIIRSFDVDSAHFAQLCNVIFVGGKIDVDCFVRAV